MTNLEDVQMADKATPEPKADEKAAEAVADEAAPGAEAGKTAPEATADADETNGGQAAPEAGRRRLLTGAVVLLVLAAAFAGWAGWSWYSAAQAGPPSTAQLRDQVLQAGEQAVVNFDTLDYRKVSQGLNLWEQSSTGTLHSEIAAGRTQFEQQITQAKTVTTAKILDGALTSLNARAGTATIIVAVQVTVTPAKGTPVVKQSRLAGRLARTPSGWKLSALGPVPVGTAGSSGSGNGG
jgi:Mce-associated membrane protein